MISMANIKPAAGPSHANHIVNIIRIVFVVILLLSLFVVAKSFIATHNVVQWSDDIQMMFIREQTEAGKRSYSMGAYLERLENIQGQWKVMRYVSTGMAVLSCWGIILTSKSRYKR